MWVQEECHEEARRKGVSHGCRKEARRKGVSHVRREETRHEEGVSQAMTE